MIVYLARDIPAFVMYCIYGESRSSLLKESTDSILFYALLHHRLSPEGPSHKCIIESIRLTGAFS